MGDWEEWRMAIAHFGDAIALIVVATGCLFVGFILEPLPAFMCGVAGIYLVFRAKPRTEKT